MKLFAFVIFLSFLGGPVLVYFSLIYLARSPQHAYSELHNVSRHQDQRRTAREMGIAGHDIVGKPCPHEGSHLLAVVIITTAPNNVEARAAIRRTWASSKNLQGEIRAYFSVGRNVETVEDSTWDYLEQENEQYGDIIQGRFVDSYSNLTLKTISMLEWLNRYCSKIPFVLKTDDDVYINVPLLIRFITENKNRPNTMFGRLAKKWKPCRDKYFKYCVSESEYAPRYYPNFLTGPGYLFTGDLIKKLYQTALNTTFFKLEDVFLTGFVASSVSASLVHDKMFHNQPMKLTPCRIKPYISIHDVSPSELYDIYDKIDKYGSYCYHWQ